MTRERLPNRRELVADIVTWPDAGGRKIHVSAGFADDGRLLETFIRGGGRTGSELDQLLDDAAVLISRALQFGDRLPDIAKGLGRLPGGAPASPIGAVIDRLAEIEGANR